jgi:homoserine kinase
MPSTGHAKNPNAIAATISGSWVAFAGAGPTLFVVMNSHADDI